MEIIIIFTTTCYVNNRYPKRRQVKTATNQNGERPKQRQVKTATGPK